MGVLMEAADQHDETVFISWSGQRSRAVARALREWLPLVIQHAKPWFSAEDIEAGERWSPAMSDSLRVTRFAMTCLTPDNLAAPWIMYEAGAVAHTIGRGSVVSYLVDLSPSQVEGPLAGFQNVRADEDGTRRLVRSINLAMGDDRLDDSRLNTTFETFWPRLAEALAKVPPAESVARPSRSTDEILEELLERVRSLPSSLRRATESQAGTLLMLREWLASHGELVLTDASQARTDGGLAGLDALVSSGETIVNVLPSGNQWVVSTFAPRARETFASRTEALIAAEDLAKALAATRGSVVLREYSQGFALRTPMDTPRLENQRRFNGPPPAGEATSG
jgi:hypothetical protein